MALVLVVAKLYFVLDANEDENAKAKDSNLSLEAFEEYERMASYMKK
jgi:hypothetical protein